MDESEVSRWLSSISCGLDLKQFSKDFEDRGFTTKESLKYVEATDLDVFFPSPRKLSYAQKKILLKEIERVGTVGSMKDTAMPQASTTAINTGNTPSEFIPPANHGSEFSKPTGFLERKQEGITDDIQFLNTRIASAKHEFSRLQAQANEYDEMAPKRAKTCSNCHLPGHTKGTCKNPTCPGISTCSLQTKHPEFKSAMAELQDLIKSLEKREQKSKDDLLNFKAAREKASNSFFAIMRPRLRKQNAMQYAGRDRLVLDRDLMTLKKALGNKIPADENSDWRLPFIIDEFKRNMITPLQQSVFLYSSN